MFKSKLVYASIIDKFVRAIDWKQTGRQYAHRLHDFDAFLKRQYHGMTIDTFIQKAKQNKIDIYDIMGEYRIQLKEKQKLQDATVAGRISTLKYFTEYNDIAINNSKFRLRVKPPRHSGHAKRLRALDRSTVRKIILACKDMRLQTYVMFLAATGWRAAEALSICYKDIDWEAGTVYISEERTKTKEERTIFLTKECLNQLKSWKDYRERERKIVTGQGRVKYVTKPFRPNDLFFTTGRTNLDSSPQGLYRVLSPEFRNVLDRNGFSDLNDYGNGRGKRHKVTLHSFRRFVKSTISNLGHSDFSEWFIGHAGSTYYRTTEAEKLELFKKIEPYLTFLDYSGLEAKAADTQTQLDSKQNQIESLKEQLKSYEDRLKQYDSWTIEMSKMKHEMDDLRKMVRQGANEAYEIAHIIPGVLDEEDEKLLRDFDKLRKSGHSTKALKLMKDALEKKKKSK